MKLRDWVKRLLLLSILLAGLPTLVSSPARAQGGDAGDTRWQTLADIPGLPAAYNHVTAIEQARDGALWFGTAEAGVVRYDGATWQPQTPADGLARGEVSSIRQDRAGGLWVATRGGGVSHLLPAGQGWHTYTAANTQGGLAHDDVRAIVEDQEGALWFGSEGGVSRLVPGDPDGAEEWQVYTMADGLVSNRVTAIAQDHDGALWFGTADAGVSRFTREGWKAFTSADGLASDKITAIWVDREGDLWFGTRDAGLSRLRLDGRDGEGQWQTYTAQNTQGGLACDEIMTILQDRQGGFWFGTMDSATGQGCGLNHLATGVHGEEMWEHFTQQNGLASDAVAAMLEDRDGALWFGMRNPYRGTAGGVSRYDNRAWRSYVPTQGMGNNWVTAILRARNGDLWLGHDEGTLSRRLASQEPEAGPALQVYTAHDGLIPEYVSALAEGPDGELWVGTTGGLEVFDGKAWRTALEGSHVMALVADARGGMWVGTDAGLRYVDGETEKRAGGDGYVSALAVDGQGRLWAGSWEGGVARYTPGLEDWQIYTEADGLASNEVTSVVVDARGQIWVGHFEGKVSRYDGETWTTYTICEEAGPWWETVLLEDRDGHVWAGCWETWNAVGSSPQRYEGGIWHPLSPSEIEGLPDEVAMAPLYADDDGAVWFGTIGGGALRYDGQSWNALTTAGMGDNRVRAAFAERQGGLWLGTYGGGVTYFPPGAGLDAGRDRVTYTTADGLASNYVVSVLKDSQGTLWVGTGNPDTCEGGGLARYDGQSWQTYTTDDGLSTNYVGAILEDRQGYVWFGTGCPSGWYTDGEDSDPWGGVTRYDPNAPGEQLAWRTYTAADGLGGHYVRAIGQDTEGGLLFATDAGVSRYTLEEDGSERWEPFTTTLQAVTAMLTDREGTLWLGGVEGSVARHWPDEGRWDTFSPEDGLAGDQVTSILQDREGTLWFGSQAGVSRYDGERWRTFTTANSGLGDDRVNAIVETDQGEIVFGTDLWYSVYSPRLPPPQVAIRQLTSIRNGEVYADPAHVALPYRQTAVQVRLSVTDTHTTADALGLRFQLEPPKGRCKAGDISPGLARETYVECSDLEPGEAYTLSVAAGNGNLDYGQPDTLSFAVRPAPPWVRPWFWPVVAGVLVVTGVPAGVWGYVRWRTRRRKYVDYLLTVSPGETGQVQVVVEAGGQPAGEHTLTLPHEEVRRMTLQVDQDGYDGPLLEFLGRRLCGALFAPGQLASFKRPARLRLDFSAAPELMAWPWELAFDAEGLGFLGQRADTALVRFVSPPASGEKPLVSQRLRVLVVMAQPADERVAELGLAEEKARLDEILGGMKQVELGYLLGLHAGALVSEAAIPRDLADQLAEGLAEGWDVVHFVGHAGPDVLGLRGDIVLWCEDRRGDYLALSPQELAMMLGGLASEGKAPKLVVLNACRTADVGSGLVQAILESGVGAVVGMQWPVLDVAARAFAEGFYGTLARHGQVDYAVSVARNRMAGEVGLERRDWAAPVLVMQTPDGIIFERV
jgi:ligand-binding sensor domain-containing protein